MYRYGHLAYLQVGYANCLEPIHVPPIRLNGI